MPHESHRNVARHKTHPWGTPPWSVGFRPAPCALPDQVDFAIVGGGFSGLSAAAWLRRLAPGRSVLVLESAALGDGASGRTGGMALAETAAGTLPGLGDVLAGYKKILRALRIDAGIKLPGVWELGRSAPAKRSPIAWNDSGDLKVVRLVSGGTVDPGRVLTGLARAAESAGAQIVENAEVRAIDFSNPPRLHIRRKLHGRVQHKEIRAEQVLLATNASSLKLSGLRAAAVPRLTFALATAPLSAAQLKAIGLSSRRPFYTIDFPPFYTIDFPYLWGRLLDSNGVIFGAGLVPAYVGAPSRFPIGARSSKNGANDLHRYDVRYGQAADRLRWLESRVRNLHPALASVRITHRWGGPILFTEKMRPIFRWHPHSKQVIVLAGYNGHGVALSVYLGKWAAEALLARRSLPSWH